jgi:hypothetical protein
MNPIGTYSFLPWLRRGLATASTAAAPGTQRATVPVDLSLHADRIGGGEATHPVHRDVQLYGPGDVVGFDARNVVRTEPRAWITNFEPNYLACVEFYDEDLPWRYTPAAPDGQQRLVPWLTLLVLAEDEFDEGRAPGKPLAYIDISDPKVFPASADLWAWAHVHVNRGLDTAGEVLSDNMAQVLPKFDAAMGQNPDLGLSRLVSPRHLAKSTGYHAFVVPTFESGRLAGLGRNPSVAPSATHVSWEDYPARAGEEGGSYPVYYRWYFRTGTVGDFEYLVRLLKPRLVPPKVGQRDMDTQSPLVGLPGIDNPALHGVLRLGGALKVPDSNLDPAQKAEAQLYENWDAPFPHPFQTALADLIGLADDYLTAGTTDPDPVITPPLYGQWHAQTSRLLEATIPPTSGNWVHELNLDPRFRVPAGFGTTVVQEHQEAYMAAAWKQIGDVLEANRRIRFAHLAREVAGSMHKRHLAAQLTADPGRLLALSSPLHRRVMRGGATVSTHIAASLVANGPLTAAMRRVTRPGARLTRALTGSGRQRVDRLLLHIATGKATAARPKRAPGGTLTSDVLCTKFDKARDTVAWQFLKDESADPKAVGRLPKLPKFRTERPSREPPPLERGERDSTAGERFKAGIGANAVLFRASTEAGREALRKPLDAQAMAAHVVAEIHPNLTIPRRVLATLSVPERFRHRVVEQFREVMAYPEFDTPMYEPLCGRSAELFVPNLNLIPPDTITLLETNQRFIEAYMVGLNHEMARELLWREFPTDQQGSYFRQFWDPTPQLSQPGETPEHRRERLRDIPPLHHWSLQSRLGEHDHREAIPGVAEEELVLVIRGELLKRYPTAVIYAQRAQWVLNDDGSIDVDAERELVDLSSAEELAPPTQKVRTPLYEAKVDPDIYFFGFDLTEEEARGDDPTTPDPDPGWFFVIRERPGEPRFGFDIERSGALQVWNDLSWDDVAPAPAMFIPMAGAPGHLLNEPHDPPDGEKIEQWGEDKDLHWGADLRASEVAYILYQAPVLVAVHAQEMLGRG